MNSLLDYDPYFRWALFITDKDDLIALCHIKVEERFNSMLCVSSQCLTVTREISLFLPISCAMPCKNPSHRDTS